jgi:ubiquinone/menaquinone biosynthesis C-methylase UbiE
LRGASFVAANGEAMQLPNDSQDLVTCIFVFHELPPEARGRVIGDMARVLKPGGTLVVVDSLQMGDRPEWDGMLEAFPIRFHEPYFRQYAIDDLEARYRSAGLDAVETSLAFLSKVTTLRKTRP